MTTATPWHDDAAFWEATAPFLFREERVASAVTQVEGLVQLLELEPPARILDLCCGPGRHSLELARRGFTVTGVDRNAGYLVRAREGAAAGGLEVELVQEDMRRFVRTGAFDVALNLFTSFGYFEDEAENRQVLLHLYESLRPGGRLVLELMGREVLARRFQPRSWDELPDGTLLLEEREVSDDWSQIRPRWIVLRGEERQEFRLSLRLYSAQELGQLAEGCGFTVERILGGLDGSPYDQQAGRLVLLVRKGTR